MGGIEEPMIALLNGSLIRQNDDGTAIILDDIRIGHEVIAPVTLPDYVRINCSVSWKILHHITQEGQCLLAFLEWEERDLAKKLAKVQGIGVKTAHRIVTTHGADAVVGAIARADVKALCDGVQGFGPKGAKSVIATLQTKFKALAGGGGDPRIPRVRAALKTLGVEFTEEDLVELARTDPGASDAELVKAFTSGA